MWIKMKSWIELQAKVIELEQSVTRLEAKVKTLEEQMTWRIGAVSYSLGPDRRPTTDLKHLLELVLNHLKLAPYHQHEVAYVSLSPIPPEQIFTIKE